MGVVLPLAMAALLGAYLGAFPPPAAFTLAGLALLSALASSRYLLAMMTVALAFSAGQVLIARGAVLPAGLAGQDLVVVGSVSEWSDEGRFKRVRLALSSCRAYESGRPDCDRLRQIQVSWYDAPELTVGEQWRVTVRLRPPSGFANPHSFDYGAWLWREGIDATGYVRGGPPPHRLKEATLRLRDRALGFLDSHHHDPMAGRWLAALTLGASDQLNDEDWALLNASGTTHLMVISGLHVGLAATFMLLVSRTIARLITPQRWRMVAWPWWLAAGATIGYACLAGLEPPAMRAMIMTLVGLWVASGRHAPGPWQGWWLALAIVLLADPLALWRPGLWLSFLAVGLLILAWQGRERPGGAKGWLFALLRSQCLLAPLMAAAVLIAFDRLSLVGPLVNLVAVPLVGSVMVPLGLLGWLLAWFPPAAELCWALFAGLAHGVHVLLKFSSELLPLWQPQPWQTLPLALLLGSLTFLWAVPGLASGMRWSGSAVMVMLGVFLTPPSLPEGVVRVRVHDVGQGQLIELRTATHRLLYDTGPRFASGFMPLSTLWGPGQEFDAVIVSHGDTDHAGGMSALNQDHLVSRWWAPLPGALAIDATPCRAGEAWRWDGVDFQFLWPKGDVAGQDRNGRSCILLVEAGEQRLIITGDAGTQVETRILETLDTEVEVLVAGHHGSRTSSSAAWVKAMRPDHVLFSAGLRNRHGHPHDSVLRRFRESGACLWSTAIDGAVTFRLGDATRLIPSTQRSLGGWPGGVEASCHAVESRARK